ncbi:flippase domain protein, partial [Escherichia coli 96.0932]
FKKHIDRQLNIRG